MLQRGWEDGVAAAKTRGVVTLPRANDFWPRVLLLASVVDLSDSWQGSRPEVVHGEGKGRGRECGWGVREGY